MLGKRRWLILLLAATIGISTIGVSVSADSGSEGEFMAKINATRESAGLAPLQLDKGLRSHARDHTAEMIEAGEIFHSSSDELKAAGGKGWDKIGENVGRGQSPSSLHDAFMDSAGHKKNILGDYNYVGIGTGSSNGYLYVTVVFMKKGSTAPATTTTTTPAETTTVETTDTTESASPVTTEAGGSPGSKTTVPSTTTTTATSTSTVPPTTTTSLVLPPDRAITPGQSCIEATRYSLICQS
jgi:hypothetical protein